VAAAAPQSGTFIPRGEPAAASFVDARDAAAPLSLGAVSDRVACGGSASVLRRLPAVRAAGHAT
jgi:hypothetical protein